MLRLLLSARRSQRARAGARWQEAASRADRPRIGRSRAFRFSMASSADVADHALMRSEGWRACVDDGHEAGIRADSGTLAASTYRCRPGPARLCATDVADRRRRLGKRSSDETAPLCAGHPIFTRQLALHVGSLRHTWLSPGSPLGRWSSRSRPPDRDQTGFRADSDEQLVLTCSERLSRPRICRLSARRNGTTIRIVRIL